MSWMQDNKFLVALGGGTLAGVIILVIAGMQGAGSYDTAKESFDTAAAEAAGFESLPVYPKTANVNMKRKAIEDYRNAVEGIQNKFSTYRPEKIENISPQEFTDRLLAANSEVRAAFEQAGATVPDEFFVGFEKYRTGLAVPQSTGQLAYELEAIKQILLELAKVKPTALKNLYRAEFPEESGGTAETGEAAAREFPLEITFVGQESSLRQFMSALMKIDKAFPVVRSLRIRNEKTDPPKSEDAQFEKTAEETPSAANDVFAGFVLPGEDPAAAEPEAPAAEATAPAEEPKADSSKILSQVLGSEQVMVFLRLDLLQFLPAKELP